jgi:oligopeptide transport system substrate-binding protein
MALDRAEIVGNVLKGGERAAHFLTPPDTAGYTCTTQVKSDIEQARALLAEAGFPEGKGLAA